MCLLRNRSFPLMAVLLSAAVAIQTAAAQVETIGTHYRPDEAFPQFNNFWYEGAIVPDEEAAGDRADYVKADRKPAQQAAPAQVLPTAGEMRLGGSLHVFLKNSSRRTVKVEDVLLGGISLNDAIAFSDQRIRKKFASIYFANLQPGEVQSLIANGEPVWWKADPVRIPPGGTAEVIVRLRQQPASPRVLLEVRFDNGSATAEVAVSESAPRLEGISFAPGFREVFLYFRYPGKPGQAPARITLDGTDITARCQIQSDSALELTPVVARLTRPLKPGSFYVFGGNYPDGSSVMSGLRAWSDEFVYGVFGGKPGPSSKPEIGKEFVDDLLTHNLNLQMSQIGSAAVQTFFKSAPGKRYMAANGFKVVLPDPGKFGITDPYAIYVHDEPDCGDFRAEGLADDKKVGALARWVISHGDELREKAPEVPQMVNLNMTFKPHNWHVYGQIPDIFAVDPYYQVRLFDAYHRNPERQELYAKATYIYMVSSVAQSSAAPNPLHVILYGNRRTDKNDPSKSFRFPTPPEKRIEVYYALAAGAKSLSYWWYTPANVAYGLGAATLPKPDPDAQVLWREIGLMGAELRTAGQVLVTSCPIDLPVKAPDTAWVRCLAGGKDTLILLAVNEQYRNTDKGTDIRPVKAATVSVQLPEWIEKPQVFEVTAEGTRDAAASQTASGLELALGDFDVTRMMVITADPRLRSRLQGYYNAKLAANTRVLLEEALSYKP